MPRGSSSRLPRYFRLTGVSGADMKEVSIVDIAFHHVKILPSCQGKASSSIRATLANCRSRQQLDRGAASPSRGLSVRWNRVTIVPRPTSGTIDGAPNIQTPSGRSTARRAFLFLDADATWSFIGHAQAKQNGKGATNPQSDSLSSIAQNGRQGRVS